MTGNVSPNLLNENSNTNLFDKHQILNFSKIEKLKYFDRLVITYPLMNTILTKIEECQQSPIHSKEPSCISLLGPSRAGKTTIVGQHMMKYPERKTLEGVVKNVFYAKVPCPANIGSLVIGLLHSLGDPFYDKRGSIGKSTLRLYDLLKKCNVQLIILDEVQHLVDRNRKTLIQDSSDWFKELISNTGIPVVFVGLPESTKIFTENEQLGGRVLNHFMINALDYNDKTFRAILLRMEEHLPLKNISGLTEPDIWKRVYLATGGLLGFLKALIKESVKLALDYNTEQITMPILAQAYENNLSHLHYFKIDNPFTPGFNLDDAIDNLLNSTDNISYGPKSNRRINKRLV